MEQNGATTTLSAARDSLSIPYLVLTAGLIGFGLFAAVVWLVTFQWVWFVGLLAAGLGGLMMFSPRTGPDRTP